MIYEGHEQASRHQWEKDILQDSAGSSGPVGHPFKIHMGLAFVLLRTSAALRLKVDVALWSMEKG